MIQLLIYTKLKEHVHSHTASVIPNEELPSVLPWVHTAISNAKRQLLVVYYKIKPEYLQYYLNQFCYKFNRRYFWEKQFDRLLIAAVSYTPDFKSRIIIGTIADKHFFLHSFIAFQPSSIIIPLSERNNSLNASVNWDEPSTFLTQYC